MTTKSNCYWTERNHLKYCLSPTMRRRTDTKDYHKWFPFIEIYYRRTTINRPLEMKVSSKIIKYPAEMAANSTASFLVEDQVSMIPFLPGEPTIIFRKELLITPTLILPKIISSHKYQLPKNIYLRFLSLQNNLLPQINIQITMSINAMIIPTPRERKSQLSIKYPP